MAFNREVDAGEQSFYYSIILFICSFMIWRDYSAATCVIVKHTNPCGMGIRGDLLEAYRLAVRADPISAFGGIVAFNREVDAGEQSVVNAIGCY